MHRAVPHARPASAAFSMQVQRKASWPLDLQSRALPSPTGKATPTSVSDADMLPGADWVCSRWRAPELPASVLAAAAATPPAGAAGVPLRLLSVLCRLAADTMESSDVTAAAAGGPSTAATCCCAALLPCPRGTGRVPEPLVGGRPSCPRVPVWSPALTPAGTGGGASAPPLGAGPGAAPASMAVPPADPDRALPSAPSWPKDAALPSASASAAEDAGTSTRER